MILLTSFLTINANAQRDADSIAIKNTALDYIEGWYKRDAQRMESALHPKLVKRIMRKTPDGKYNRRAGCQHSDQKYRQRRRIPHTPCRAAKNIAVLDEFGNAAVVKVTANRWVDYFQMVKWKGEWKILNVLCELK